jgi:uncharacterized membrane protein (UPF0182 family)
MDPRSPTPFPRKRPTIVRPPHRRSSRLGRIGAGGAVLLLLLLLLPALIRFYVDYLWFAQIEFLPVLLRQVVAQAALVAGVAALAFGVAYGSARLAQRGTGPFVVRSADGSSLDVARLVRALTMPAALLVAVPFGLAARHSWMVVLQAWNATRFDLADPIFGRDVSYYVFLLPLFSVVMTMLFALGVLALIAAAISYWLRGQLGATANGGLAVDVAASRHLAAVGAFLFMVVAARIWLVGLPELLYSTTGPLVGVSYTDQYARRPGLYVCAVAAVVAAALLVVAARRGRLVRGAAWAVGGFVVVSILARGIYPAALQRLVVDPTELTREAPFLAHHIDLTRRAWNLDRVETRALSGAATITLEDVRADAATIENVRLWDDEPLLQTFGQLQEIRTYYDFVAVDDDRYWIDGRYRQVLLSPRELNPASLPTRTFINEHLTFTHGMGLTLAPVNEATRAGLPVLFVKDLPPRSLVDLEVQRPQIYYGELTANHVFVNTRQPEFDFPAGEENVFTSYDGVGGVPMGGLLRRALFAAYLRSMRILLSGDLTADTRVLYHRSIAARAAKALPFLHFDPDPYLVIRENGHLVWMLDAYTRTDRFPYAARLTDGTSYMRNSVKVLIDAYDGTVEAFVADPEDPMIRTQQRIFPGILRSLDEMPEDVLPHIRYPTELYRVQMAFYTVYHMDDPEELYHREDQWQIPVMDSDPGAAPFMRRIIMRLPHEERAEYIFMTPFNPRQKDNLTAWVVARSDAPHYGELVEYRFPRQSLVFGPRQVVNRINQDTEISRQLSLWDQRGSEVIRGELMVIPIGEAPIYVQPIYLRAEGGRIPELKRVVVSYDNRVVMEETLEGALTRIFGAPADVRVTSLEMPADAEEEGVPPAPAPPAAAPSEADVARNAKGHYERAIEAQRAGDWARYGEEIRLLGEALEALAGEGDPR